MKSLSLQATCSNLWVQQFKHNENVYISFKTKGFKRLKYINITKTQIVCADEIT